MCVSRKTVHNQNTLEYDKKLIQDFPFKHEVFPAIQGLYTFAKKNKAVLDLKFSNTSHSHVNFYQIISPSSTESTSYGPSESSQTDNISVGVSPTPTPALPLTPTTSAITEVSSQGGYLSSKFSSFLAQNASTLMSESITFFCISQWLLFPRETRKVKSKSHILL